MGHLERLTPQRGASEKRSCTAWGHATLPRRRWRARRRRPARGEPAQRPAEPRWLDEPRTGLDCAHAGHPRRPTSSSNRPRAALALAASQHRARRRRHEHHSRDRPRPAPARQPRAPRPACLGDGHRDRHRRADRAARAEGRVGGHSQERRPVQPGESGPLWRALTRRSDSAAPGRAARARPRRLCPPDDGQRTPAASVCPAVDRVAAPGAPARLPRRPQVGVSRRAPCDRR